jgi:hypothetical protein
MKLPLPGRYMIERPQLFKAPAEPERRSLPHHIQLVKAAQLVIKILKK